MTIPEIIEKVAAVTGVPVYHIVGCRRPTMICRARFLAAWAIRQHMPYLPLIDISYALGRIDHGTALHQLKKAEKLMAEPHFKAMADQLTANF